LTDRLTDKQTLLLIIPLAPLVAREVKIRNENVHFYDYKTV